MAFEDVFPEPLKEALDKITLIPSYGERGASRFVYNLLKLEQEKRKEIVESLARAVESLKPCSECYLLTDPKRLKKFLCVVEESQDAYAIERLERYRGVYHVLQGRIAPLEGISPQDLTVEKLMERIEKNKVVEVILATNPNAEGEATANYLAKVIRDRFPKVKISRISYGLQFGTLLEFADTLSLEKSIESRKEIEDLE